MHSFGVNTQFRIVNLASGNYRYCCIVCCNACFAFWTI